MFNIELCCILNQTWFTKFSERTKHFFYSWKEPTVYCWFERWMERHILRERDSFLSCTFFWETGGANTCTPLQAVLCERPNPLIGYVSLARLLVLCTLSKSDHVITTWSPSGYTPVGPKCPDVLSSPCLLITTLTACQSIQGH